MEEIPAGLIQTKQLQFAGKVNHSMDHKRDEAIKVWKHFADTGDREGTAALCEEYGFASVYHAGSVASKAGSPETIDLELDAITIGDSLAFVTAPNELFDTNSVYTEEHSPYKMTFTCGYCNGHWFYIPSQYGYDYSCYESHVSRFAPGTGETVSEQFLRMLREMKGE